MKLFVSLLACVLLAGCCAHGPFIQAVDSYTKVMLPEYETYIQNDTTLSLETKQIRVQSAERFKIMVDKAKEGQK